MPQRKVKILKGLAGEPAARSGDIIELDAATAKRFVEHGIAEYVAKAAKGKTSPPKAEGAEPPAKRSRKGTSRKAQKSEKR